MVTNLEPKNSPLQIIAEADKIRQMYKDDPRQKTFNLLLLGELGSGKTFLIRTARKPVHIDSFDPGGAKGLRENIEKGEILVDSRYESEDPMHPSMFPLWKAEMDKRQKMGYFKALGTYVLDSSTYWAEAIMNDILKKAQIAGQVPRFTHDYNPQKITIRNFIRLMIDLPCDFILTGHLESMKEDGGESTVFRFMTTGKGTTIIPTLFDEVWIMEPKGGPEGTRYRILTKATGKYLARSRLAADGLLSQYEPPDIKAILKKVGLDASDKPLLMGGK